MEGKLWVHFLRREQSTIPVRRVDQKEQGGEREIVSSGPLLCPCQRQAEVTYVPVFQGHDK